MAEYFVFLFGIILLGIATFRQGDTLFIDGCPMYGCRPSGSFSFYLNVPRDNVTLNWQSRAFDPVPNALGCVADNVNIVCQTNGVFSNQKGYSVLNVWNGSIEWRESILVYPPLPILDNYGDVTGSDGFSLVHYDADGTKYPVIPCEGLNPVFSISLVGSTVLLLVSKRGQIVVRETDGVPIGNLFLNATVGNQNGTFVPIAQPVINEQLLYVLTEFVPTDANKAADTTVNRLYAIQVFATITDRIKVAWYFELGSSLRAKATNKDDRKDQGLLLDTGYNQIYANLPYFVPDITSGVVEPMVFVIGDDGKRGKLVSKMSANITHMARFKPDHCSASEFCGQDVPKPPVWLVFNESRLLSLTPEGKIKYTIDLDSLLQAEVKLLTKLSVTKKDDTFPETLIFGAELSSRTGEPITYLVAIDVTDTSHPLWVLPVPGNPILKGQIVGSSGADVGIKDQLVVYAENRDSSSASILSFH